MQVTNLCPICKIMRDFVFVSVITFYAGRYFVFDIKFDELFEHKDLFAQVHYFLSALCSSLLIKRLFQ